MMIIGCDYHPSWQQIALVDTETGETGERKLMHGDGAAERFYRQLAEPGLWSKEGQKLLRELPLPYWAGQRRENLLRLMSIFDEQIAVLDQAAEKAARESEMARLLMTQPGVGPIPSLAFVLTLGDVTRFPRGKQVASYLGLIPREYTTGGRQRLGAITKQGHRFLRMLLVETAHSVIPCDPR